MMDEFDQNRNYDYDNEYEEQNDVEIIPEDDSDDNARRALDNFGTYDGPRNSDNERHGLGKTVLPNGDVYVGMYKNNKRHGYGLYKFKNGAVYRGFYRNNLKNHQGIMRYPDKSKYQGHWCDNKKHGDGTLRYANKDEFSGSWKCDMKHGVGTYLFYKSKVVLNGMWSNGKRVSNFQYFFPASTSSGFTFHGTWDDNENVSGEGYYVFKRLMCMQSGIYVNNDNSTDKYDKTESPIWYSNRILPIVTSMLPRMPKKKPVLASVESSSMLMGEMSETTAPAANRTSSFSRIEMYEHKEGLWNEPDEFESGEGDGSVV